MINVAICGATGYTGLELIRILLKHPRVKIKALTAKIDKPVKISEVFPELLGTFEMVCSNKLAVNDVLKKGIDVVFLALPHKVSMDYVPRFLDKGKIVIDLSADFRLKDTRIYEKFYGKKHLQKKYLFASAYGLPELCSARIKKAKLIANPGCYPTGSILGIAPLLLKKKADLNDIVIDAKSGVTGAGRKAILPLHFSEVNENIKAYKIGVHQHCPEIEQELSNAAGKKVSILFTPHLVPINRGILTTAYVALKKQAGLSELVGLYKTFYKKAPFVRVYDEGSLPEIKNVTGSNYCDIGIALSPDKKRCVIVTAIDNLLKGASGQAVQNMNIVCGFPEATGLV
ncbi:MAG: N-acetyl-gamma-glutamyl-phosphate reductase [Candidatus Omnitrophica bacterium]|nr:N-acetyl-gamma-glutamyl-phosphate reductase [Candidatus Omnitrophota bacterium]